jgi:hypothetical protein
MKFRTDVKLPLHLKAVDILRRATRTWSPLNRLLLDLEMWIIRRYGLFGKWKHDAE